MLMSLVSLQQGNVKISEKSMKKVNIKGENLLNELRKYNGIFGENMV